jgi:AbiV family abortive infection protein
MNDDVSDHHGFPLEGGWFTLEQAGRLLQDARHLFDAARYSSAVGLALLSREELAKSRELFSLSMRVNRGEPISRDNAIDRVGGMSHREKQRRGASMFTIPVDAATLETLRRGRDASPSTTTRQSQHNA